MVKRKKMPAPEESEESIKEKNWFQRHPLWTIFIALVLLGQVVSLGKDPSSSKSSLVRMEAEVVPIDNTGSLWEIRNRNDYPWHNVSIIVNKYYSCGNYRSLDAGKEISLYIADCEDYAYSYTSINTMKIITNEGTRSFERK